MVPVPSSPLSPWGCFRCGTSTQKRADHLDGDDHDEVRDRDRGEESQRCAPGRAPDDGPRSGRLRDDQIGHSAPGDQHHDDVCRDRQRPQVAAGQGRPAAQRDVVGEVGERRARQPRSGWQPRPARPAGRIPELAPADLRPGALADRPAGARQPPRIVSVRRAGIVSGVWPASSATASANRSTSSSVVKNPTLMRTRVEGVDGPGDREHTGAQLGQGRGRGPAVDAERHQRGHLVAAA